MGESGDRKGLLVAAVVLAVVAALIGLTQGRIVGINAVGPAPGEKPTRAPLVDPLAEDPAPQLLPSSALDAVTPLLNKERTATITGVQEFWGTEKGRPVEDSSFQSWLAITAGSEPTEAERDKELATVNELTRTDQTEQAANWLSAHGCKDVWASYAIHDAKGGIGDTIRKELDQILTLATRVAAAVQRHYNPSTETVMPCGSTQVAGGSICKCTYPSPATIMATAARTYLGGRIPSQERKYTAMERQVAAAGLFQRRELPSDVDEGARIGFLVGRYFAITRGYPDDSEKRTSTATPTPTP